VLKRKAKRHKLSFYSQLLAIKEINLGPTHPEVVSTIDNLATFHYHQGKFDEAERLYKRMLAMKERARGPAASTSGSQPQAIWPWFTRRSKVGQAESLYKEALQIVERLACGSSRGSQPP